MFRRLFRAAILLTALIVTAGTLTFLYLGWSVNRTGSRDQAQIADVIVVLGARVEPNGQPGPDLQVRTLHAVGLFQRGLAPYVICTGGYRNDRLSAAAVSRQLAIAEGIPPDKILLADGSMTTGEDAASTRALMQTHGWQTAILVSHPLHLERARVLFESLGLTVYPSPTSTNLSAIPLETRLWLTVRETGGIVWIALDSLGVPYEWSTQLSHWVYDSQATPGAN